ncbi:type I-E CRISPR-associated protein Cse2/CasB [Nocardiopsis sp. NPDC057823]|uniref:type I-E CRISPR-associated protein Cse2/CasB n=1 Tax=Nocardiopsis sp. NPDC057823 TaxID=3346256 RepID=UPI00366D9910
MSTESEILRAADRMVKSLEERVRDEPAVRATLRRAAGRRVDDPAVLPVHTFVARYLNGPLTHLESDPNARRRTPEQDVERAFYGVAAMIAAQPRRARDRKAAEGTEGAEGAGEDARDTLPEEPGPSSSPDTGRAPGTGQKGADPLRRGSNLGAMIGRAVTEGRLNGETTEGRLHLLCRQSVDGVHSQLPRLVLHARDRDVDIDWGRLTLDLSRWGGDRDAVAKEWVQSYHRVIETERARREKAPVDPNTTDETDEDTAA